MSAKHTPGPWGVEDYGGMGGLAVVADDVTFDIICWPHPDNARLIAAAPEMLEALNAFPAEADFSNAENFRTAAIAWFEMIARPAIAKAEGQS